MKLSSVLTFKRAKVFTNSNAKYAKFKAKCNDYGAQLVGILYNKQKSAM